MEAVGTALAVAGLLSSAKSVLDGYNLLADIFAKDNGLRFLATQYHVEKVKLEIWNEHVKINDPDNCILLKESQVVQEAVLRIMGEIVATHDNTARLLEKYDITKRAPTSQPSGKQHLVTFGQNSWWVIRSKEERDKIKQKYRVSWTVRDKGDLTDLVDKLGKLNRDLRDVVRHEGVDVVRIVTGVLSGLGNQIPLAPIQQLQIGGGAGDESALLVLSAKLKDMQEKDVRELASSARLLHGHITPSPGPNASGDDAREIGYYEEDGGMPAHVWVEWKSIRADDPSKDDLIERIKALSSLLTTSDSAQFLQPTCVGVHDDREYEERTSGGRRIGFIYDFPASDAGAGELVTLKDMLSKAKKGYRPPLGERFELARKLVVAVALLHATNWIHKSLRSDNILFASGAEPPHILTDPRIAGFQYSRPAGQGSIEKRAVGDAELEMYYHPEVPSAGWTKVREIYSLGIVLLEIGTWRSAFESRFRTMSMHDVSNAILDDLDGKFGNDLMGLVGKTYVDVVKCCLKGSLGVRDGTSDQEAQLLSKAFFHKVVKPLSSCKA